MLKNNIQSENLLEECTSYFKKNKAYERLFLEIKKKYKKYGKATGKIKLLDLSAKEEEALRSILGRQVEKAEFIMTVSEFQRALDDTKFKGITITDLLRSYYKENLITNKEANKKRKEDMDFFWEDILKTIEHRFSKESKSYLWLRQVKPQRKYGYQLITKEYKKDEEQIKKTVVEVCEAVEYLQNMDCDSYVRLAVLGANITKNPHTFDRQNLAGKILLQVLFFVCEIDYSNNSEDILQIYYLSGIRPDDISSFTACYGIHFYTKKEEQKAYREFIKYGETYVVTLANLNRISCADSVGKKVYMIENQMVFSQLCELLDGREVSVLCTSGQLKIASYIIIDMLLKSGCQLYYSGDIDPEGIEIADKVAGRNPNQIVLWRMTKEDYYKSISEENLSDERIKKLDKIQNNQLIKVCDAVVREKKAGYQEQLIYDMLNDMLENV